MEPPFLVSLELSYISTHLVRNIVLYRLQQEVVYLRRTAVSASQGSSSLNIQLPVRQGQRNEDATNSERGTTF